MMMFRYLHPSNWKYAPKLYHACWWTIFLILFLYALMFPSAVYSSLTHSVYPLPLSWLVMLPILALCITVVHRYSTEIGRHAVRQGETIVRQALALQQAQAKIDYLLRVLHDLQSPITAILNAIPLVENGQTVYMQSIKSACSHVINLVSKSFRDARVADLELLKSKPMFLAGLFYEVMEMLKPTADKKGQTLKLGLEEGMPGFIEADPQVLARIMMNLLENAIAYSPVHKELLISCYTESSSLVIQVTNEATGPIKNGAFQPYVRGTEGDGKGLGLAIVRTLAERMGGSAYSELQEGGKVSVFVRIPLIPSEPPKLPDLPQMEPVVIETIGKGLQVMIVEDDGNLRTVISENLIAQGIASKVIGVASGKQAIDTAIMMMPDVIITDNVLIGMDGLETVKELKRMERTKGIPVLVMTGTALPAFQIYAYKELGVCEFLPKPFNLNSMKLAIDRTLA